ncbi:MAG: hypothetical protein Q7R45_16085, partial [Sulfuricaulis sp.]|nr:hypothetical protein [Sulfuricaulis sp.]
MSKGTASAAIHSEQQMSFVRLTAGRHGFMRAALAMLLFTTTFAGAAEQFPFDRELLLDAAPMRPAKRIPSLTVAANGNA